MNTSANIALVPVNADLDVTTVPALRRTIDALVDEGCRRVVLNLGGASFVDSAGVGLILAETRRMRERGGLLSLTNVTPRVLRALTIARIVDFVPVSAAGPRPEIPRLDASALPRWRTSMRIDPKNLAMTRASVEKLLARMSFTSDDLFDLTLAVGEAMGNAVDHAGGCSVVTVSCYQDRAVVDVTDCGEGFEVSQGNACCADAEAERGRGIALMRLLADSVTIERRQSGTGMLVRIVKLFS